MGNKPAKPSSASSPVIKREAPAKVPSTEEPKAVVNVPSSPESSPSVPAYDPEKEKTTQEETRELDTPLATQPVKQEVEEEPQLPQGTAPTEPKPSSQQDTPTPPTEPEPESPAEHETLVAEPEPEPESPAEHETLVAEPEPEPESAAEHETLVAEPEPEPEPPQKTAPAEPEAAVPEPVVEAAEKVALPPLALEKLNELPPPAPNAEEEEEEEEDPDLMKPPPFLMDAMSSLQGTEEAATGEGGARRSSARSSTDELLLASPITHDEVTLVEPTPVSEPEEVVGERDDVSIDDAVSAADTDQPSKSEATSDPTPFVVGLGGVPEDTVSLTSSVAREDELLKNIMGTSVGRPAATSNESVRGSIAVSEMTFDETQWDITRRSEEIEKPTPGEEPLLLAVTLDVGMDDRVILRLHDEQELDGAEWDKEASHLVPEMMNSIVARVIEHGRSEDSPPEAETQPGDPPVEDTVAPARTEVETTAVSTDLDTVPVVTSVYETTAMEAPTKQEGTEVSVVMEDVQGEVKLCLIPKRSNLTTAESEVSDQQFSVKLETPFGDISESQDLGNVLDDVPEGPSEGGEGSSEQPLSRDPSSHTKPRKSRSRRKRSKAKSAQAHPTAAQSSVSDGSASVESSGKEAVEKPPPDEC